MPTLFRLNFVPTLSARTFRFGGWADFEVTAMISKPVILNMPIVSPSVKHRVKTKAESLATLIELGFSSITDAIDWADEAIAKTPGPASVTLCKISMAGATAYPQDIVHHLRSIPGDAELTQVALSVICRAKDLLQKSKSNWRLVATGLRELAIEDSLPLASFYNEIWWFDDALDLSESRYIPDSQDEIVVKMIEALSIRIAELSNEPKDDRQQE